MRVIFWRKKCRVLSFVAAVLAIYVLLYLFVNFGRTKNHFGSWERTRLVDLSKKDTSRPKQNFVFIKTMKCGTQTLASILRRFTVKNKLNGVTPLKNYIYLGWPYPMSKTDCRPSRRPFNTLIDHAVYSPAVMHDLMPPDTVFFTIIREPFSHFKSTFNYFGMARIAGVKSTIDVLKEYSEHVWVYEARYQSPTAQKRWCIPSNFSITRNLQSHCLGMPLGFPPGRENITSDPAAIQRYIHRLSKDFALVMLMDYFDESLILLRRLMHWKMQDLLYLKLNIGNYSYRNDVDPELKRWHQQWSQADYLLYDFFNKTFWQKVAKEGAEFTEEVSAFVAIQKELMLYCQNVKLSDPFLVAKSKWMEPFVISKSDCKMMENQYRDEFMEYQNKLEPDLVNGTNSVPQQGAC